MCGSHGPGKHLVAVLFVIEDLPRQVRFIHRPRLLQGD